MIDEKKINKKKLLITAMGVVENKRLLDHKEFQSNSEFLKSPRHSTESNFFQQNLMCTTKKLKLKIFLPSTKRGVSSFSEKPSFFKLSEKNLKIGQNITSESENKLKINPNKSDFKLNLNQKEFQKAFDHYGEKKIKRDKSLLSSIIKINNTQLSGNRNDFRISSNNNFNTMKKAPSHRPYKSTDLYLSTSTSNFKKTSTNMMNSLKNNLANINDNKKIKLNFSEMARQLKTFRNIKNLPTNTNKASNFDEDLNDDQYSKLTTQYEGTKHHDLNFMKSLCEPEPNKQQQLHELSDMKRKLSGHKTTTQRENFINSKNSLTVLSKTTKENSVVANSSSPRKLIRCSFLMNINCNDIEGPEELHFFNMMTSQNNKGLAKKFDRNLENLDEEVSEWSF